MKSTEDIGSFKIYLPDENSKQFYIFCDLAELIGEDYQGDAVSKLKKKINELDLKPKPNLDYESDRTSIRTSNFKTIIESAKIIDQLSSDDFKSNLQTEDWQRIEDRLKNWKRPQPQDWNENDVFSITLKDGTFAFGQVLTKEKYKKTFALFDLKSDKQEIDINQLKKADPLTILHLMGLKLNDKSWTVVGQLDTKLANPLKGPWGSNYGTTGTDGYLESIANYYWFKEHDWKDENSLKKLIMKKNGLFSRLFKK